MNLSVGLKCDSDGEPEPFKALTANIQSLFSLLKKALGVFAIVC